jgi:hypothetical protein
MLKKSEPNIPFFMLLNHLVYWRRKILLRLALANVMESA